MPYRSWLGRYSECPGEQSGQGKTTAERAGGPASVEKALLAPSAPLGRPATDGEQSRAGDHAKSARTDTSLSGTRVGADGDGGRRSGSPHRERPRDTWCRIGPAAAQAELSSQLPRETEPTGAPPQQQRGQHAPSKISYRAWPACCRDHRARQCRSRPCSGCPVMAEASTAGQETETGAGHSAPITIGMANNT